MIEAFKTIRRESIARRGNRLTQASVNRELEVLSKIFNKAIDFERVDRNPCKRVEIHVAEDSWPVLHPRGGGAADGHTYGDAGSYSSRSNCRDRDGFATSVGDI